MKNLIIIPIILFTLSVVDSYSQENTIRKYYYDKAPNGKYFLNYYFKNKKEVKEDIISVKLYPNPITTLVNLEIEMSKSGPATVYGISNSVIVKLWTGELKSGTNLVKFDINNSLVKYSIITVEFYKSTKLVNVIY